MFAKYTKDFSKNLQIAYPIILGQLAHMLVALADNIMVGRLGKEQLAAVSLGNTLIFIALSIGIGFSFAITPLVAEADAQNDTERVRSIFHNGVLLCFVNGLILLGLLILSESILYRLNQPEEVVQLAIPYMRVVAFSMVPLMIFQAIKQFSDGLSHTIYAMYATLGANVINVLLNFLLIYGEFGFPRLEVVGAAYGTLIARLIMIPFLLLLLYHTPKFKEYFIHMANFSWNTIKKLTSLGLPTALQMFFEVSLFTAAIFISGMISTSAQAANQIALNLSAMTFMVGVGLSVTATIRVGNQLGRKDYVELERIARSIFLLTFVFELFFALVFLLGKDILPLIYISDSDVIAIASTLLIVSAFFQISDGFQVVFLGALRGLQDVWVPSLICFISYWVIGLPISYYLGIMIDYGAPGIWIGLLVGLSVSALLMYVRYRYLLKAKKSL